MTSSSSPVTSSQSNSVMPNSFAAPYQQFGLTEAARLYGQGGQTALPAASDYITNMLQGKGGQGYDGATNQFAHGELPTGIDQSLRDTAAGNFVNANPYIDQMFSRASRPVIDSVQSMFSKAGRFGSAANQDVLGRTIGDLSAQVYGKNYADERSNQLQAGNAITGFNARDMDRQLQASGMMNGIYTNNANRELQAAALAPGVNNAAMSPLDAYIRQISGINMGQTSSGSSTQPYFSNPVGEAASAFGSLGLGANLLFGNKGVFPGAASSVANTVGGWGSSLWDSLFGTPSGVGGG